MFQKPTFGSNTSGFGSFNAGASTSSPFGGFKSTTGTGAFGAPSAFGASTSTQSTSGGGLFGASTSTGGLFGSTSAPTSTPAFGTSTSGFGFGGSTTSGGLFSNNTSTGLFGNTANTSAFGAKPPGFGFGGASTSGTTGGLFSSTPSTSTGLFGSQNTALGGGGLFSNTSGGFGQQQAAVGTAHVKYSPLVGTDVVVKSGTSQNINTKHHCITCMKEYENKSLEELRMEDYTAGRKGSAGGMFGGGFQQQTENKPLFGGSTFGQPATTSAPSMFGGGLASTSGFGQTSTFSFGNATQNQTNTTGLFGANKPAFGTATTGTGLFGATTTQAPSFGTNTSTFGFGATNTQNQTGGLFGAKPATTGFGTTPSSGFGSFGTSGSLFGAKPQQTTAPAFGTTTPAFGLGTGGFGTNTSTTGLFGANNSFGKLTTTQPTMGFGNTQPTLGLGTGLGANTFQAKPAGTAGFGSLGTGLFGQQPGQTNTFKTGLEGGLGGGIFGNTSTLGSTQLGGFNTNTAGLTNPGVGGTSGGNVHEQILTLAARPYGDSPLFKDLLPDSTTTAEDVLKPTNPAAVKAVLDSNNPNSYRVTSPTTPRLKLVPRAPALPTDKKSLFDGLEESDSTLEDKLSLKPSRKRLVLRANNKTIDSTEYCNHTNRSLEDSTHREVNASQTAVEEVNKMSRSIDAEDSRRRHVDYSDSNGNDTSKDKHVSWLSSPKAIERVIEKPIDEPTPRLYPDLNNELGITMSERRASWLTTKPFRKPLVSNPDSTDISLRELGVRSEHAQQDKENIDNLSVSEEEQQVSTREMPRHPTGIKLTRPGYYTVPSLDEMISYMRPDGTCIVPHLTIGRHNYGDVHYDCNQIDVAGLDLDALVHFRNKEVIIYPEDSNKPPIGEGLNRRAVVTLDRVWPRDKTEKRPITDPRRLMLMDYEGKLRRVCDKHDTKFIEYRPQTGSWVFRVEHFSRYGLSDSDEEDDDVPDVLKRQIVNQALQRAAPITTAPKPPAPTVSGLGGLGGLGGLVPEDNLYAIHQTPLILNNVTSKVFDMNTSEHTTEVPSLYQDTSREFTVKSPTSELAKLEQRQTHNIQLMKASLYADTEMEDDVSVSTGDQLVPQTTCLLPLTTASATIVRVEDEEVLEEIQQIVTEEVPMKPLIIRPLTVILNYHRKVPPFKHTIAGRLDAACIADMSVCRARHSRISFGPSGALAYATTYVSVKDLPKSAELYKLGDYVRGRDENDWSEPLVAMLALGQQDNTNMRQVLSNHLSELLEFSSSEDNPESTLKVPRLCVSDSPKDRLQLLRNYVKESAAATSQKRFGVSGVYWHQIWKLCEALWGADLENDGVPGTDDESILNRHKKFLEWLKDAVSDVTDEDLARPIQAESEDKSDGHSVRVWTLMLGGRVVEACKLSRESGDVNMALLLAQATSDRLFRSLIARQLSLWNDCLAKQLISSHRLATLQLISGGEPPAQLSEAGWLRCLLAAANYICPQVPTVEQVVRKYESFFSGDATSDEIDLTVVDADGAALPLPLPSFDGEYNCVVNKTTQHRVLDLRYQLIRSRAFNTRPKLMPASYTPDPLDYTMCFLLGTWFGNPTVQSITGVADQLEAAGDWHLAVQALAYHPDDMARNHLIRNVLSRHAPSQPSTPELQSRLELVRRLSVPEKWLRIAQAHRAKYERLPAIEAQHLIAAGEWNAAHEVVMEHLLSGAVLNDDLQSVSSLLEQLNSAAEKHEVSGWENGGQALYHYMHICQEIQGVVCGAEAGESRARVQTRLEALRPRVASACRALAGLQAKHPQIMAARAKIGARLVQFRVAGGAPPHQLAAMLKSLRLPPDTAATATQKITSELAEQASELCIESVPSSPLSSRHRTVEGS